MPPRPPIPATGVAVACLFWLAGVAAPAASAQEQQIGAGDTLRIRISELHGPEEDITDLYRVDEDGCVELPRIGRILIAGWSESAAVDFILDKYRGDGFNPGVAVYVVEKGSGDDSIAPSAAVPAPATAPTTAPSALTRLGEAVARINVGGPILGGIVATLLAGTLLMWRGLRGRRIDSHPLCRRCSFDLFGLPPGHPRCPECGADLLRRPRRAVRVGHRERRTLALTSGVTLLIPATAVLAAAAWSTWQRTDPNDWKPAWWLAWDLKSPDAKVSGAAIGHLSNRLRRRNLSATDIDRAARQVLAVQGDPSRTWSTDFGDFVEDAAAADLLGAGRREQYLLQGVPADLQPPAGVRLGSIFPVKLRVGPPRLGKTVRLRVEFAEPTVEVAGRAVDRAALETISSYVLHDAESMENGKLTILACAQLPRAVPEGLQTVRLSLDLRVYIDLRGAAPEPQAARRVEWGGKIQILPPESEVTRTED